MSYGALEFLLELQTHDRLMFVVSSSVLLFEVLATMRQTSFEQLVADLCVWGRSVEFASLDER